MGDEEKKESAGSRKKKEPSCVKGLISLQEEFLDAVTYTLEVVLNDKDKSKSWLKSKKKILDTEMDSAAKNHKTILAYTNTADNPDVDRYLSQKIYTKVRDAYCDLDAEIADRLVNEIEGTSTVSVKNDHVDLSLPRLDLPTFSGKYEEWLPFNNLFKASVGNKSSLDPVQKLHYLMKSVTDDAYVTIKNLSLTADNYEKAMDLLDKQFNHTRKIAQTYMKKLLDSKPIANENVKDIRNFISNVKDCMISLEDLKLPVKDWSYILLYVLQSKVPHTTYTKWEEELGSSRDIPKLEAFMEFLEKRYRTLEMLEVSDKDVKKSIKVLHTKTPASQKPNFMSFKKSKSQNSKTSVSKSNKNNQCTLCHGDHLVARCKKFLNNTPAQRRNLALQHSLCVNCLGSSHSIDVCYSMKTCIYCKQQHHSLLHIHPIQENSPNFQLNSSESYQQAVPSTSNAFYTSTQKYGVRVLGTALVRLVNLNGFSITARILLDPGAEENYITSSTVNSAGLKKYHSPSSITGLNDINVGSVNYKVNFKIESMDGKFEYFTEASVVNEITSKLPSSYIEPDSFGFLNNLPLADPHFNHPCKINLLLGVGFVVKIRQAGIKKFKQLMAEQTSLGWVIMGQVTPNLHESSCSPSNVFLTKHISNNELSDQIKKFFDIEECSNKIPPKPEDELCERKFLESVKQCDDGHLSIILPFRENNPIMGPSKNIAMKRFFNLERKLQKNEYLKNEYHETIKNYLKNSHLIPVTDKCYDGREYFLPHHAVLKESSTTTKVRVVFDGSCKSADGSSLNDNLLTGPKLQSDIRDIFFNWRSFKFALTADIEKMYRMIWIDKCHHNYQKILWRFDENESVKEYALTTVTFGTSSAPFQAIRALNYIAELETTNYPLAAKSVLSEFYVDDFISGAHSLDEAVKKQTEMRQMLKAYGFNIRKWSSNITETLIGIEENDREILAELRFEDEEFRKTLGVYWAPKGDFFSFSTHTLHFSETNFTKRNILSLIARLYDPLGWVGPCTLYAKLIMQRVWEQELAWDEEVSGAIKQHFQNFLTDLSNLSQIKIARWNHINDDQSPVTLYGFSDASLKAYGAVVYLLNTNVTEQNRLILLASKTKVKPLKHVTLARLELCAAALLADLLKWATTLLKPRPIKIFAFSDSKIVLSWLNSHPSRWKMYVASRTSKILETTTSETWKYINTKCNPADFVSRGLLPSEIVNNSLWWNGPSMDEISGTNHDCNLTEEDQIILSKETKDTKLAFHTSALKDSPLLQLIEDYSSHGKMCRIISHILTFIKKTLMKIQSKMIEKNDYYSSLLEMCNQPEMVICRLVQSKFYLSEIRALKENNNLNRKSSLLSLHPFLDGFGVLRVGGRLQNSILSYNQRHPIILPTNHQVVKNIILLAHHATLHGGNTITEAYIRHKYHIIRVGERIKYYLQRCPTCIRFAKHSHNQLMGSLPQDRVNPHRAFLNSGVDYAGPFTLKAYGGRCKKFIKHYIALFICFSTKAVHLELVSELTANAFLAAFKRFVNRRGQCQRLYSDRGTNFVKGDKMLTQEIHLAQISWKSELEVEFETLGTIWEFNPPGAPHFGGLWESGIKSMKQHLYKTIGQALLTSEEFYTLLVQIEGILNSRPLYVMNSDPNNMTFLSPAHFLIGETINAPPERNYVSGPKSPLNRWQYLQKLRQSFWNSWRKDYLHRLNTRTKWKTQGLIFKIGDLVLLTDDNCSPTNWPKAIITDIHPGSDGQIRVLTLKTEKGQTFKRPIAKVRLLPIREDEFSDQN